ncbi:hypothetical protein BDK62_12430 [Halomonas alkaliantarctica]|nr:hypothetical protein BDK62_12430 [Halomonas alkaliantarctica]
MILDKLVYSYDEVAEMFEVKRTRVSSWVREGRLNAVSRGKITVGSILYLADLSRESIDFGKEARSPDEPRYEPRTRIGPKPVSASKTVPNHDAKEKLEELLGRRAGKNK